MNRRMALILAVGAALLAACARSSSPLASAIGGPFRLVDQNGNARDQRLLRGKWTALYFGYTFCPDVCPTTLTALGQAQKALGGAARKIQFVFVTVDPARDTPGQLKTYLSSPAFPAGTIGLTGSPAAIAQIAQAYHVYYRKVGTGPNYSMDHTSVVYLMRPDGRFAAPLDTTVPPPQIAAQITQAMNA